MVRTERRCAPKDWNSVHTPTEGLVGEKGSLRHLQTAQRPAMTQYADEGPAWCRPAQCHVPGGHSVPNGGAAHPWAAALSRGPHLAGAIIVQSAESELRQEGRLQGANPGPGTARP